MEPILPTLRANADPMDVQAAYVRGGNPRGLPETRGPTRGVGGHSYTGTYPQGTPMPAGRATPSPTGGPDPQAMQLKQLQYLAQLPEAEFEQVAGLFPREIIAQLRVLRAQMGLGR